MAHTRSCESLFSSPSDIPSSVAEKLAYIEKAIRSGSRNAFKDIELTEINGVPNVGLQRLVSVIDFEDITKNQILLILSRISKSNMSVHKQLLLKLQGKKHLAQNDLNTMSLANDLMYESFLDFVSSTGNLQDRDVRDHFMIYVQKFFPFIRFGLTNVSSVFSLLQVANLSNKFRSALNPENNFVYFSKLSPEAQQRILEEGLLETQDETRLDLGRRSGFALNYQMTMRSISLLFAIVALVLTIDEIERNIHGKPGSHYFDDLIKSQFFQEIVFHVYLATLIDVDNAKPIDEKSVRLKIQQETNQLLKYSGH